MTELVVRNATVADATRLLEIYRPYVEHTVVSFEYDVPSIEQFTTRVASALDRWAWVVAEREGVVIGYAYGSAHRAREAYAKSVETSAYVDEVFHRAGVAQALYTRLFDELSRLNFRSAYAGITVPNDASIGFHAHFGFRHIGVFPNVGYKLGDWRDVAWMYRPIQIPAPIPAPIPARA
ncbi:MAG: L-amino acid N-acyltransferase YncA [Gammaproteobacteria bacterium]|jgi:L-amino acid N-acyltransferase YncA